MGPSIIARNYAETALELARRSGGEAAVEGRDRFGVRVAAGFRDAGGALARGRPHDEEQAAGQRRGAVRLHGIRGMARVVGGS